MIQHFTIKSRCLKFLNHRFPAITATSLLSLNCLALWNSQPKRFYRTHKKCQDRSPRQWTGATRPLTFGKTLSPLSFYFLLCNSRLPLSGIRARFNQSCSREPAKERAEIDQFCSLEISLVNIAVCWHATLGDRTFWVLRTAFLMLQALF